MTPLLLLQDHLRRVFTGTACGFSPPLIPNCPTVFLNSIIIIIIIIMCLPSCQKNTLLPLRQESNSTKPFPGVTCFNSARPQTILSFIIMKHEMPDNLINMCCISFSALTPVGRKEAGLCPGLPGSQEVIAVGQWGTLISWKGGMLRRRIPFWSRLADGLPGERQMGIIPGPDDKRPILMSLFSHCGASLSSQNLFEQPGKMAFYPPSKSPSWQDDSS